MGRKTKLTKKVQDYICAAVEQGANVEMRSLNGGITVQTYLTWRRRGEAARALVEKGEPVPEGEAPYLSFLEAVDESLANYGLQLQQVIAQYATRDPIEARRELQRLFPADYAPPAQRHELGGPGGGALQVEHTGKVEHGGIEHVAAVLATLAEVGALQLSSAGESDAAEVDELHTA